MKRGRDVGRLACYRAEWQVFDNGKIRVPLTFAEFRDLCLLVFRENGGAGRPLNVELNEALGRHVADANSYFQRVRVTSRGLFADVAIHEVAHVLTPRDPGHGPEWRALFARLLDKYHGNGVGSEWLALATAPQKRRAPRKLILIRRARGPVLSVVGNVTTTGTGAETVERWEDWPELAKWRRDMVSRHVHLCRADGSTFFVRDSSPPARTADGGA